MDYGKVLARAWNITWRWKILWLLGFLAILSGGGGGNVNYQFSARSRTFELPVIAPRWIPLLVIAGIAVVLIWITFWVISTIAKGSLIAGVQQVEDEGSTSFRRAWRVGVQKFWSLFGVHLIPLLAGIAFAIAIVAMVLVFGGIGALSAGFENRGGAAAAFGFLGICFVPFCCLFVIAMILLAQVITYAERAIVLEGKGAIDALGRGWQVLKDNLGHTVIFWLIFLVIGIVYVAVLGGIMVAVALPFISLFTHGSPDVAAYVVLGSVAFIVLLLILFTNTVLTVFTSAAWTLAYREFTRIEAPRVPPEAVAPLPSELPPSGEPPVAEPPVS